MAIDLETLFPYLQGARWRGRGYIHSLCPYHADRKPSFLVDANGYTCMAASCGKSGMAEELLRFVQGSGETFEHRTQKQAGNRGLYLPQWKPENMDKLESVAMDSHVVMVGNISQFGSYLVKRGLRGRIEGQMLGWFKSWYTVPIFDREHIFLGMVLRPSDTIEKDVARFSVPRGQPPMLYVPDWQLLKKAKSVFVVFGLFDALTLCELRVPVVTSSGGATTFAAEWLSEYRKRIYVIPDAGEEAVAQRLIGDLDWRGKVVRLEYDEEITDPNDYLKAKKQRALMNQLARYM